MIYFKIKLQVMKSVHFHNQFLINIGESVEISEGKLLVTLKNVSRLMVPKKGDQFILVLNLDWEGKSEDIGIDGAFRFSNPSVERDWQKFRIQIHDIDMMAKFVIISIRKLE